MVEHQKELDEIEELRWVDAEAILDDEDVVVHETSCLVEGVISKDSK